MLEGIMNDRRRSLITLLIAFALMPAIVLSAVSGEEEDPSTYLPLIRTFSKDPVTTWAMAYGYEAGILFGAGVVVESDDGGFVYCGTWYDRETTGDPGDIVVTKVDSSGEIVWQKWYDDIHYDRCAGLDIAVGGKLFVAGSTGRGEWFAKLDHTGTIIWQKRFLGDSSFLRIDAFQATTDGGFVVAGHEVDSGNDLWIAKFNGDGNLQWLKKYGNVTVLSAAIDENSQGGYFVGGTWWSETSNGLDFHVLSLDADGEIVWQKAFGESNDESFMGLDSAEDGGLFVAGLSAMGPGWSDPLFWVMRVKEDGSVLWHKELVGEWDMINTIQATPDGGCLVAGNTADGDMWLLKMRANGTAVWQRFYLGTEWDEPSDLLRVSSGGYLLAGQTRSYGSGDSNAWLLRVDEAGKIVDCPIDEAGSPGLVDFSLPMKDLALTAVTFTGVLSSGDLTTSNGGATRTMVCKPATSGASQPAERCQ
jgi:hypothetical protein